MYRTTSGHEMVEEIELDADVDRLIGRILRGESLACDAYEVGINPDPIEYPPVDLGWDVYDYVSKLPYDAHVKAYQRRIRQMAALGKCDAHVKTFKAHIRAIEEARFIGLRVQWEREQAVRQAAIAERQAKKKSEKWQRQWSAFEAWARHEFVPHFAVYHDHRWIASIDEYLDLAKQLRLQRAA